MPLSMCVSHSMQSTTPNPKHFMVAHQDHTLRTFPGVSRRGRPPSADEGEAAVDPLRASRIASRMMRRVAMAREQVLSHLIRR
jgi:hypothetical protein